MFRDDKMLSKNYDLSVRDEQPGAKLRKILRITTK